MTRRSLRLRITVVAVAATTVVLLGASIALVAFQRSTLTTAIDDALLLRSDDAAGQVESLGAALETPGGEDQFIQLVDFDGEILAASPGLGNAGPVSDAAPAGTVEFGSVSGLPIDDDTFRVVSRQIDGVGVLHLGTSLESVEESVAALVGGLALTIPLLDAALAALTWVFVGRTLRPVDAITAEVEAIGATQLNRRVPHPETDDEIGHLADTMNAMLERLQRAAQRQQRFVADASHELRSPLTRLRTMLEVELNAPGDPQIAIGSALEDVIEMQQLTDDLLRSARADAEIEAFNPIPIDLDDIVMRELEHIASRERVEVDRSAVSAGHVNGDPKQLTRLVRNLLDNAERHARSTVRVTLAEQAGEAILTVQDDGPGVEPAASAVIFDRFGRADAARSAETGGAGLGLAIAREIAERHNGSLRLLDRSPGATFELRLPALP
jgi:signal transduction histidine kinase